MVLPRPPLTRKEPAELFRALQVALAHRDRDPVTPAFPNDVRFPRPPFGKELRKQNRWRLLVGRLSENTQKRRD